MIAIWGLMLALPLLAYGALAVWSPGKARDFATWFETSRRVAATLTVVAWFWTAWELDHIGIDVFDMFLKRFPGELWLLAAVLSYLTVIWMPKSLSVRALTGILMLFPAALFRSTRLLVPESGVAPVHILVVFAYLAAVTGMYGMFYPWRLEKGLRLVLDSGCIWPRVFGGALVLTAFALLGAGFASL